MSADLATVVGEQRHLLAYIPPATFGYMYHLSGNLVFLGVSIYLLWGASVSIHAAEKNELLDIAKTTRGSIKAIFVIFPFYLSFFVGAILILFFVSNHSDLISVALGISNFAVVILLYPHKIQETVM